MANKIWRGDALPVAQVDTITAAGTWSNGDTATMTMNGKSIVVTFGNGAPTTTQVAAALKAAWSGDAVTSYGETRNQTGDNVEEFAEITATSSAAVVTLTHNTKGVPFTLTVSDTSAGSITQATATAASGEALFDVAGNWSASGVPVDNDALYFFDTSNPLLYNISQSGVGPTSIDVLQSFTGTIGLPRNNTNGYFEYRATYLILGDAAIATTVNIGQGDGSGSGRIKLNMGAGQTTLNVFNTGNPIDSGVESILFLGTHASNVANIKKGSVGIAVFPGETATIATLRVGYIDSISGDAKVRCGSGVTLTTLDQTGGTVELNAGLTTATISGGSLHIKSGNVTTWHALEGTSYYSGTGTISTLNVQPGAVFDLSKGQGTATISTINLYPGSTFRSSDNRLSSPTFRLNGCSIKEVVLEVSDDFTITHV